MQCNGVSHGDWCNARTRPTKCKACKADVFYFSCACGSKVFFDSLGGKWPEHICVQVKAIPKKAISGSVAQLISHHKETSTASCFYARVSKTAVKKRATYKPIPLHKMNGRKIAAQRQARHRTKELIKEQEKLIENIDMEKALEGNRADAKSRGWIK